LTLASAIAMLCVSILKEGYHAGLLCKVPRQERDEERQGHHHEEWPPGDSGCLPLMRHQDVQNRRQIAGFPRYYVVRSCRVTGRITAIEQDLRLTVS
jgi:hypothetical protein